MKIILKTLCLAGLLFCFSVVAHKVSEYEDNWITCQNKTTNSDCYEINLENARFLEYDSRRLIFALLNDTRIICSYEKYWLYKGRHCSNGSVYIRRHRE